MYRYYVNGYYVVNFYYIYVYKHINIHNSQITLYTLNAIFKLPTSRGLINS